MCRWLYSHTGHCYQETVHQQLRLQQKKLQKIWNQVSISWKPVYCAKVLMKAKVYFVACALISSQLSWWPPSWLKIRSGDTNSWVSTIMSWCLTIHEWIKICILSCIWLIMENKKVCWFSCCKSLKHDQIEQFISAIKLCCRTAYKVSSQYKIFYIEFSHRDEFAGGLLSRIFKRLRDWWEYFTYTYFDGYVYIKNKIWKLIMDKFGIITAY